MLCFFNSLDGDVWMKILRYDLTPLELVKRLVKRKIIYFNDAHWSYHAERQVFTNNTINTVYCLEIKMNNIEQFDFFKGFKNKFDFLDKVDEMPIDLLIADKDIGLHLLQNFKIMNVTHSISMTGRDTWHCNGMSNLSHNISSDHFNYIHHFLINEKLDTSHYPYTNDKDFFLK